MASFKPLLFVLATAVAFTTGAVLRSYPFPPPFEANGLFEQTQLYPFGIPLSSPFIPLPMQYGKADCNDATKSHHDDVRYLEPIIYNPEISNMPSEDNKPVEAPAVPTFLFPNVENNFAPSEDPDIDRRIPVIIPEGPVLPPFTMPEMPAKIIIDEPAPCDEPEDIREEAKHESMEPEKVAYIPAIIPEAPVLPPFTQPEIPVQIVEEPAPYDESKTLPVKLEEPSNEYLPPIIPEAPVLPPFTPLEIPNKIIDDEPCDDPEDTKPEEPKQIVEEPAPYDESKTLPVKLEEPDNEYLPPIIPEAPVLPPFTPLEIPNKIIDDDPEDTKPEEPKQEEYFPVIMPEAPSLPPFTLPEISDKITLEEPTPCDETENAMPTNPEKQEIEYLPAITPEAPVLPPFMLPEMKLLVEEPVQEHEIIPVKPEEPKIEESFPLNMPEAPVLPPLPELPLNFKVEEAKVEKTLPIIISENTGFSSFNVPETPIKTNEPTSIAEPTPKFKEVIQFYYIPEAPLLAPLDLQELTVQNTEQEPCDDNKPLIASEPLKVEEKHEEVIVPEAPLAEAPLPCTETEVSDHIIPKLYINEHSVLPRTDGNVAPAPLVIKAPMQIIIRPSDLSRFGTSEDCLHKYIASRIISNIL